MGSDREPELEPERALPRALGPRVGSEREPERELSRALGPRREPEPQVGSDREPALEPERARPRALGPRREQEPQVGSDRALAVEWALELPRAPGPDRALELGPPAAEQEMARELGLGPPKGRGPRREPGPPTLGPPGRKGRLQAGQRGKNRTKRAT